MNLITLAAFSDELTKIAGRVDHAALHHFTSKLEPGDVVQFNTRASDAAKKSIRSGVSTKLISDPIRKVTGSQEHHTAMYTGMDESTGHHMITHNYEQGGKSGIHSKPIHEFADTTGFSAYRPHGVSKEERHQAAQHALELAKDPHSKYSKRNLVAAGVSSAADKTPQPVRYIAKTVSKHVSEDKGPSTGICSELPVRAYSKVIGDKAAKLTFTGHHEPDNRLSNIASTPASIKSSPFVKHVASYSPADQEKSFVGAAFKRLTSKTVSSLGRLVRK